MLSTALLATERHHAMQRRANRNAVIRHLCARPGSSAPELAIALGLPMSVVAPLLRQFMLEGLLLESRERGAAAGRVLPRYRLDATHLALLGADVGADRVRVVATSLDGRVLAGTMLEYGRASSAMRRIDSLATAALRVCEKLGAAAPHVIGMGLGLPGSAEAPAGESHGDSLPRSRDVPFASLLARELERSHLEGMPLFLGSSADVAALGEFDFAPAPDGPSLLYLSLDEDLDAGVIVDGEVLPARRRRTNGIGHTVLQVDGPRCSCGRSGCAQALIGSRSLLGTAEPDAVGVLGRRLAAGSPETVSAVARAGACLGTLLHNLAILYRPSRIVVGGSLTELGEALLQPARLSLGECAASGVALATSRFGGDAVAVGAAALARRRLCGRPAPVAPAAPSRCDATRTAAFF
ncbi:MAG TPA: ROK family protein [Burkholderiaceae bacterium]